MRILHVTTFLQGGAGRVIAALAIAQSRAGHDVQVVADAGGEPGYASYTEYVDALAAAGVPLRLVRSTFKRDPALNQAAGERLRQLTADRPPDLVHAHAATPAVVARLAGLGTGGSAARIVHTMHGWGITKTVRQAASDLAVLDRADAVATPSYAALQTLRGAGLTRADAHVIPYGIGDLCTDAAPDPSDVAAIRARGAGPVALCIGTFGERKNQRLLIQALAAAGRRDTIAVFIGDGDPAPLEAHAAALGVLPRTVILGHRTGASRYLALADALVLPSRNEGLPLAVLEALRAGVPVVGTAIPEIAEAMGPELSGGLVPPDDPVALDHALQAAFVFRQRLAVPLKRRFERYYRLDGMVQAYAAFYASALARPSAPARGCLAGTGHGDPVRSWPAGVVGAADV